CSDMPEWAREVAHLCRYVYLPEYFRRLLFEHIGLQGQLALEGKKIKPNVGHSGRFPADGSVRDLRDGSAGYRLPVEAIVLSQVYRIDVAEQRYLLIAQSAPGGPDFQVVQPQGIVKERFLVQSPCG